LGEGEKKTPHSWKFQTTLHGKGGRRRGEVVGKPESPKKQFPKRVPPKGGGDFNDLHGWTRERRFRLMCVF